MKRCFALLSYFLMAKMIAFSQLVNNGATITVTSGATIKCTGNIINNSGGVIQNAGIVSSDGELRNESGGTIQNNGSAGVYEATTKFVNKGNAFSAIKLRLIGSVNTDSILSGAGSTYDSVILAKGSGFNATLSDAMTVNLGLVFNNDNNKLILGDKNLTMASGAVFQNPDNNQFVVTNGTGTVTKQSLGTGGSTAPFVFPVGYSSSEFNPVTITNSISATSVSVYCLPDVRANGLTGTSQSSDFANNSWVVSSGGSVNLTMTGQWVASDQLSNFNPAKCGIARFNTGTDWDLPASNVVAASGSDPYTRSRSGITSTGVFAVADLDKVNAAKLNLKVFLQGPYNGTTMNDGLRSSNVIPTTQPYSSAMGSNFNRIGVYDGSVSVNETVSSTSVFDVGGTDNDIVDWIYVSLQDGSNPATKLQTRAALVQRDGDIVEYDPVSASYVSLRMPIDADGNYHLLIAHRNHLAIRTPVSQALQDNATFTYNFTDAQSKAYQDGTITTNAAMAQNGSVYMMWAGNANADLYTRVTDQAFPVIPSDAGYILGTILVGDPNGTISGYSIGDINMDGKVRATDQAFPVIPSDIGPILGIILSGNPNATRREHK